MMNTTDPAGYERGFFDVFFTSIGVFVTSLVASFTMVGIMMGQPHSNWKQKEDDSDEEDELPFIQRFYEEFNELEEKDLDDDEKKKLLTSFLEKSSLLWGSIKTSSKSSFISSEILVMVSPFFF